MAAATTSPTAGLSTILTFAPTSSSVEDNSLSDAQDKALAIIPIISGLLSAWGSANIISSVYHISRPNRHCYHRIMLGLSVSDLISSLVLSLQSFLLPANTSHRVWATGTEMSCPIMGFFQQLSLSSILYSGMLSLMYLLTIKYSVTEEQLSSRSNRYYGCYEFWFHLTSIGFPVATATMGAAMGMYAELNIGHFCWFDADSTLIAYIVGGIPSFAVLLMVMVNNMLIVCHVRNKLKEDRRRTANHGLPERYQSLTPHPHPSDEPGNHNHKDNHCAAYKDAEDDNPGLAISRASSTNVSKEEVLETGASKEEKQQVTTTDSNLQSQQHTSPQARPPAGEDSSTNENPRQTTPSTPSRATSTDGSTESAFSDEQQHRQGTRTTTTTTENLQPLQEKEEEAETWRRDLHDLQRQEQHLQSLEARRQARVQTVAWQAVYYVVAFVLCYAPTLIVRVTAATLGLEPSQEGRVFGLLVIQAILWPLQGLFNFVIYSSSPSYLREIVVVLEEDEDNGQ